MQLFIEIAIASWSLLSVALAIWTYHDAWLLAFSRGWAVSPLIAGPPGFAVYILRSRLAGKRKNPALLPEYEARQIEDDRKSPGGAKWQLQKSSGAGQEKEVKSEFEPTVITQGLPRCPRCGTAVSYYDVKCMRCGQLIQPAIVKSSA